MTTTTLVVAAIALVALLAVLAVRGKGRPMRVLALIDIQNGFMPLDPSIPGTGELPVEGAPAIVPNVNKLSALDFFDLVVESQDYHPADHGSFYTMHEGKKAGEMVDLFGLQQILWNPHCRQKTPGCEFYPTLDRSRLDWTFPKGMDKTVDSYSAIWDNGRRHSTGMGEFLRDEAHRRGFTGVQFFVVGVTRPFCPSWTAKDAAEFGFDTYLVEDACSLLELAPGAGDKDIEDLKANKVKVVKVADVLDMAAAA